MWWSNWAKIAIECSYRDMVIGMTEEKENKME
jgi:hypothetical protein